ncbi:MAG: DUF1667 domain-containing protein [Spirochaetales bacterium]|nr:DUF1667 domain-containing protein [Spirochaetales bacterium]
MTKTITCIVCPRGCPLQLSDAQGQVCVTGNGCKRGEAYGKQEAIHPLRTLTTTVCTDSKEWPRLPVRLSQDIPLEQVFAYMKALDEIVARGCWAPGDVVAQNLLDAGVDVVATGELVYGS